MNCSFIVMPGNRIKAGSGAGEMAVVMMVDSGDGGVAGDGTCANDCDGDVVTVVVMVMMVVVRMLARVLLLLAILLYEIYEEVVLFFI